MRRPLLGSIVVITRPKASAAPLAAALQALGARVAIAPLIRTAPPRSWRALDEGLRRLERFDAAVFASANAVEAFFSRARKLWRKAPPAPPLVAAVGPATAAALLRHGWRASVIPESSRAEGLARSLRKLPRGSRVLLPRAERGRRTLILLLRAAGARVTPATAYRTLGDRAGRKILRRALRDGAHAACFASGSAVRSAVNALGRARARRAFRACAAVAIGPVTASALRAAGIKPAAVAVSADSAALVAAVSRALGKKGRRE